MVSLMTQKDFKRGEHASDNLKIIFHKPLEFRNETTA